jgi:hypothetical protein
MMCIPYLTTSKISQESQIIATDEYPFKSVPFKLQVKGQKIVAAGELGRRGRAAGCGRGMGGVGEGVGCVRGD